jgi:hypothetical protein
MEKFMTRIIIILAVGGGFFIYFTSEYFQQKNNASHGNTAQSDVRVVEDVGEERNENAVEHHDESTLSLTDIPLDSAFERVTKKHFGLYVDPENSPVQPERFRGYHTGTDFEIREGEIDSDVEVRAICDGAIRMRDHISGYGGVVVQECAVNDGIVTVIYGHLDLDTVPSGVGVRLFHGDRIGLLGAGESRETDGERKHLHLGVHKGKEINLKGYVARKTDLAEWIDPCTVVICTREM